MLLHIGQVGETTDDSSAAFRGYHGHGLAGVSLGGWGCNPRGGSGGELLVLHCTQTLHGGAGKSFA